MNTELWQEDITYLNKKIQKEFSSFNPIVKSAFSVNSNHLKEELSDLDNETIAIKIGKLVAELQDGHTEMSILQSTANFKRLPIGMYFFEEKLHVFAAQEHYTNLIGTEVIKVGEKTIPEIFNLLKTIMAYDNDYEIYHAGPSFLTLPTVLYFLGITTDESVTNFTFRDESDVVITKNIEPVSLADFNNRAWKTIKEINSVEELNDKNSDKNYWFEYLAKEKTMYFYFGRVNNQKGRPSLKKIITRMFDEIDKVSPNKLIIDLRDNNGGNNNKSRPLIEALKKRAFLNKKGRVYVITGRRTFSAAMVTSIFLKKETNALIVGEPSRGHPNKSDNVEYMNLPNSNLEIEYTTKVKKHWEELGDLNHVPVDVEIAPNFKDYISGEDSVLNYILRQ